MVTADKLMAIAFSLAILGQAYAVKRVYGSWTLPACLFGLFWFAYTFVPLVALLSVPVEPLSVAYILAACVAFSLSTVAFDWHAAFAINRTRKVRPNYRSSLIWGCFLGLSVSSIGFLIVDIFAQGFTVSDIAFNLLRTASRYMAMRYTNGLTTTLAGQISTTIDYPAAILGGLIFANNSKLRSRLAILGLAMAPSILKLLIQGDKGTLFLVISLFYGGILVAKLSTGNVRLFEKGIVTKTLVAMVLIAPIVLVSFLSRGLFESTDNSYILGKLSKYVVSYSFAHLYAFSDWFSYLVYDDSLQSYKRNVYDPGFYTFTPLLKLFGNRQVPLPGFFDEYFRYADLMATNIYTMFRGLIVDFGLFGSLVFMTLFGGILNIAFWCLLTNDRPSLSASIYVHSIGFFYTSFIISLWVWNSPIGSLFLTAALLAANNWLESPIRTTGSNMPPPSLPEKLSNTLPTGVPAQ